MNFPTIANSSPAFALLRGGRILGDLVKVV